MNKPELILELMGDYADDELRDYIWQISLMPDSQGILLWLVENDFTGLVLLEWTQKKFRGSTTALVHHVRREIQYDSQ